MHRRVSAILLLLIASLAGPAQAADPILLSCFPPKRSQDKAGAYVDGTADKFPATKIDAVRVLARLGEDVFEFFPEHAKVAAVQDGVLRLHMIEPLSAGETAELRLEGKVAEKQGEPFNAKLTLRGEKRIAEATLTCTLD